MNKSIGADEISFNVIKNCFGELIDILKFVFYISLQIGIFLDPLNIVTWSLETLRKLVRISNYRPNSILPCFGKILERIMYKRLYRDLVNEKILYSRQFGFQKDHSTEHAIVELADKIHESFEKRKIIHLVFVLIYLRPLTLLTMQY